MIVGETEVKIELIEGDELDLECIFTGQPTPKSTWTKDGIEVASHIRVNCDF